MKKCAILVIASICQDKYKSYIKNYWSFMIRNTKNNPNLDIYLLFDYGVDISDYSDIRDHIIVDLNSNYNGFTEDNIKCRSYIPGILSKTVFSFKLLRDKYDIFFRTNLSSMIIVNNILDYINNNNICYSGFYVWGNALRSNLICRNLVGKNSSIKDISDLQEYPGNTFISGSGYFLNSTEVDDIVKNEEKIRYDIIDDVSIGLMIEKHKCIDIKYHLKVRENDTVNDIILWINKHITEKGFHIRTENFSNDKVLELYNVLKKTDKLKYFC